MQYTVISRITRFKDKRKIIYIEYFGYIFWYFGIIYILVIKYKKYYQMKFLLLISIICFLAVVNLIRELYTQANRTYHALLHLFRYILHIVFVYKKKKAYMCTCTMKWNTRLEYTDRGNWAHTSGAYVNISLRLA